MSCTVSGGGGITHSLTHSLMYALTDLLTAQGMVNRPSPFKESRSPGPIYWPQTEHDSDHRTSAKWSLERTGIGSTVVGAKDGGTAKTIGCVAWQLPPKRWTSVRATASSRALTAVCRWPWGSLARALGQAGADLQHARRPSGGARDCHRRCRARAHGASLLLWRAHDHHRRARRGPARPRHLPNAGR
jgi:hypothetical protein